MKIKSMVLIAALVGIASMNAQAGEKTRKPAQAIAGAGSCMTFPNESHSSFCTSSWQGGASATVRIGGDSYTIDSTKTYPSVDSAVLAQKIQGILNNGLTPDQAAHITGPLTDLFGAYLADPQGVIGSSFQKDFLQFLLK